MALVPADRYSSADALKKDLENWIDDAPVAAWPEPLSVKLRRWLNRHRTIAAATAVALLAAVVFLGILTAVTTSANEKLAKLADDERDAKIKADDARQAAATDRQITAKTAENYRRFLYAARANQIQVAVESNKFARVQELLDQQRPGPGEEDLRGFEWHYFDRLTHPEAREVQLEDFDPFAKKRFGQMPFYLSADGSRGMSFFEPPWIPNRSDTVTIRGWNLADGRNLLNIPRARTQFEFEFPFDPFDRPMNWSFADMALVGASRDGQFFAISHAMNSEDTERTIEVWDLRTQKIKKSVLSKDVITTALSPDGRHLAAVLGKTRPKGEPQTEPRAIKIWDLDKDTKPFEFATPPANRYWTRLTFVAGGNRLILQSATPDENELRGQQVPALHLVVFDTTTGRELTNRQLAVPNGDAGGLSRGGRAELSFSADGSRFADFYGAGCVVWEVASG